MTKIDPDICPLCGEQNNCGMGKPDDCWCRSETFSGDLIQRIPHEKENKACICQNCVKRSSVRVGE